MNHLSKIKNYLDKSGGIITAKDCTDNNIPTVYLSRLANQGILNRVSPGIYLSESGDYDEFYFFQYRYTKTIFSYETALYLLGVTDKIIQIIDVTVSSNYKFNESMPGINIHYVRKEWLNLGAVEVKTIFENPVRTYSYERTICDSIMHKEEIDTEEYVKLLRAYTNYEKKNIHELYEIANKMGIANQVREIMEILI